PRGHFIKDVAGRDHDFWRNGWDVLPRVESEEAEVELRVAVAGLESAKGDDAGAGAPHGVTFGVHSGDLHRGGGTSGGGDFGAAAGIDPPTAVGLLAIEDGVDGLRDAGPAGWVPVSVGVGWMHPELKQDVVRFERRVGGELAAPVAFGRLQVEE